MSAPESWAVGKNLPPGLWLPTAEEPTDQYLTPNFAGPERLEYERLVDYGAFVVALAVLGQAKTSRTSLMPTERDLSEMYRAGYGISTRTLRETYGGLKRLQRALGFYPYGYEPTREELLDRFQWVADYAYWLDPHPHEKAKTIVEMVRWGSDRNLTPNLRHVTNILDGDTTPARKIFGVEKYNSSQQYTRTDLFRFAALVISEHGGPLGTAEMNRRYKDAFVSSPYATIRGVFGKPSLLWREFDYIPEHSPAVTMQDIINFGMQWAILHGTTSMSQSEIESLARKHRFPTIYTIGLHFPSLDAFREKVARDYAVFEELKSELNKKGVTDEVVNAACQRFEAAPEFINTLKENVDILVLLSRGSPGTKYVVRIINSGFDLLDLDIMEMQFSDFVNSLRRQGIADERMRFVFDLVPRCDTEEALARVRATQTSPTVNQ